MRICRAAALPLILCAVLAASGRAQDEIPELTRPVNDIAGVIDAKNAQAMDRIIRSLQAASGDVVVVATIQTFAPYADIREYAVRMFGNKGRGIGEKGKDNGLLILLAVNDRRVWMEVGYGLEPIVTDGFAGETSRQYMTPAFRRGDYGAGLLAGVERIAGRIADARGVELEGVQPVRVRPRGGFPLSPVVIGLIVLFIVIRSLTGGGRGGRGGFRRSRTYWGGPFGWSGWNSGIGSFGGGFGGGGFGGGFGGFGGGRSGGGGGGAGW